jgi:PKD repeat protein
MNPQIIHSHFKTKLARAFVTSAVAILLGVTGLATHAQTVIWSDNFNIPDTSSLDGSTQTGRHTGLLANNVVGRSGGIQLTITSDELNLFKTGSGNDGRMRFADSANTGGRWDWASGIGGSTITNGGGMRIDFDWTAADNTSGDWVSYSVGITPNSDVNLRILDSGTASGILFKNNGSAQVFHNGTGGASANFGVSSLTRHVTLLYAFTSFADGSPVTLTAYVNGTNVMSQSFTWNANSGVQNMEISSYANGTRIGNFTVSSVNTVVASTLSLSADTTASPSTNVYANGSPVTLSAAFVGTSPITNQWEVNTGSGFVPVTGATNTTLTLTNLQLINSGASYALFASNPAGASNSTPVTLTVLAAPTAISWNHDFYSTVTGPSQFAGVVSVANWTDSWIDNNQSANLRDSSGAATSLGFSCTTTGDWMIHPWSHPGQDADGTYNKELLNGYQDSHGQDSFTLSGIPYTSYTIYVYLSSDAAGRHGMVSVGSMQYDFSTLGSAAIDGSNAQLIQTTSTNLSYPSASYAVFTNLTGSGQTITWTVPNADGLGIAGWQVVNTGPPYLSLAADTTASPSSAYVGGAVTFSASFGGTKPITNQWEVNTGSGFVPLTGATNTTLTLTNLQLINSGASYALFASNPVGASNSTPVTLTVLAAPTSIAFNVQFIGGGFGSGHCPVQTGAAVIGGGADVWNTVSNPNGSANPPAGQARGTNLTLLDVSSIGTTLTMDYVGDYIFNSTAYGSNPFKDVGSPVAHLMSGYMGSVTQSGNPAGDTNTITLHNLLPGIYDLYLYGCGANDGQTRVNVYTANGQSAVCGPNSGSSTLTAGVNYVHLTPTVTTNGLLNISYIGTADNGQALLDGFQVSGPSTAYNIFQTTDTSSDSPATDYVGRTVTFSAAFGGNPTPTLQWEVNKGSGYVNVPNATNSTLTLPNVQTTDSGSYSLYATNVAGGLNSTPWTLTVQALPSVMAVNVQFAGSSRGSSLAAPQVGAAVIGGGSDFWNPVSNPNPTGATPATNMISGSILGLTDTGSVGTSLSLAYTGNTILNSSTGTPFNGSGSPAANLMQACLGVENTNTGTVTLQGLQAGTYDLYLYSSAGNALQTPVTRFAANGSYDAAGPNSGNNVLTEKTNYVHLTPIVSASGVLTVSLAGLGGTADASLNGLQLSGPGATVLPPVASFTGTPTNVFATQSVAFTDTSSGNLTNWIWSFGDGSSVTNSSGSASHAYAAAGTYTVSLTARGPGGSNTTNIVDAVTVYARPMLGSPVLSAGSLTVSGTGGIPDAQYRILTSTNVALPLASWTPVATNTFAPDGSYSYTQSFLTNAASFFRLVTP